MDGNACWVYPILSILQVGPNIMVIKNAGGPKGKSFSRSLSLEVAPQAQKDSWPPWPPVMRIWCVRHPSQGLPCGTLMLVSRD